MGFQLAAQKWPLVAKSALLELSVLWHHSGMHTDVNFFDVSEKLGNQTNLLRVSQLQSSLKAWIWSQNFLQLKGDETIFFRNLCTCIKMISITALTKRIYAWFTLKNAIGLRVQCHSPLTMNTEVKSCVSPRFAEAWKNVFKLGYFCNILCFSMR